MHEVDFTGGSAADATAGTREGAQAAAARLAVDLSPTTSLGTSRLTSLARAESSAELDPARIWFLVTTEAGAGVVLLDQTLAVSIADALMGGPGTPQARPLTSVEERVLLPHLQRAARTLGSVVCEGPVTLGPVSRGPIEITGPLMVIDVLVESLPTVGPEPEADPDDPFGSAPAAPAGPTPIGAISMAVPAPAGSALTERERVADADLLPAGSFVDVQLPLSVRTRPVSMAAGRAHGLSVGDQVVMRHPANEPLVGMLGGVPRLGVELSAVAGQLVAHVLTLVDAEGPGARIWPDDARVRPAWPWPPEPAGADATEPQQTTPAAETAGDPTEEEQAMINADQDVEAALAAATGAINPADGPAQQAPASAAHGLGHLADVPVEVAVEVGRTLVTLREALSLAPGQVLTLDAEAGEPAMILVNGRGVARGQVLVVGDVYGVRITEILDAAR